MEAEAATVEDLKLEVKIAAPAERVFAALTDDIGRWWPGPFYCGKGRGKPVFTLEARPGGRMWEDWGDGEGLLWGTVVNLERGRRLELTGTTGTAWGGPNMWFASFELTDAGNETVLRFSESSFGRVGAGHSAEKEKGWKFLLADALRAYLEGHEPPVWED